MSETTPGSVPLTPRVSLSKGAGPEADALPGHDAAVPVTDAAPVPDAAGSPVPEAADAPSGPPARRRARLAVLAVVALLTAGLAAVALLLYQESRDADETAGYYAPSSAPLSAARTAGRVLFSYDHRTLDKDFADAKALTTGTFAEEYAKTTQSVVRPVALENKAVVEATTAGQALASAEPGKVVALVFVNQVTTSTKVQGQKVDQSRVRMTLVERGGRWLVSKVEAL